MFHNTLSPHESQILQTEELVWTRKVKNTSSKNVSGKICLVGMGNAFEQDQVLTTPHPTSVSVSTTHPTSNLPFE